MTSAPSLWEIWTNAGLMGNAPFKFSQGQFPGGDVGVFAAQIVQHPMPFVNNPQANNTSTAMPVILPGRANIVGTPTPRQNLRILKAKK